MTQTKEIIESSFEKKFHRFDMMTPMKVNAKNSHSRLVEKYGMEINFGFN